MSSRTKKATTPPKPTPGVPIRKPLTRKINVPIYDACVLLSVADNMEEELRKMEREFGPPPSNIKNSEALTVVGKHFFGLFFDRKALDESVIAHEIFHLTHLMLAQMGVKFDSRSMEPGAYLCGYLTDRVCRELDRASSSNDK